MKKTISILLMAALVLSISITTALGETASRFVDENKDGVCDLYGATDANGDGVCDGCPNNGTRPMDGTGRQLRRGGCGNKQYSSRFVDANGDGVCDNRGSGRTGGKGQGSGK